MENASNSEVPDSPSSLILPSEPPDIRNWFPSYKYESFVLDTYNAGGGTEFKEIDCEEDGFALFGEKNREKEKNLGESGKNGESDDKHEEESLNSTCSLSALSELPYIGNWFSSYVYESPVLDTVEDLKGPVLEERGGEKEGFAFGGTERKGIDSFGESWKSRNRNEVDAGGEKLWFNGLVKCGNSLEDTYANEPSNEIPDSLQTPSTLSEPPDIRNWFFSYVYKSPPESNVFSDKETEFEGDDFANQQNGKERNSWEFGQTEITGEVVIDEKVNPNGVLGVTGSLLSDNEQEKQSLEEDNRAPGNERLTNHDDLRYKGRQSLKDNKFGENKDLETTSWNDEGPSFKQQQQHNYLQEADAVSCQIKDRVSQTRRILGKDFSENLETKALAETDLLPPAANMKYVQGSGDLKRKSSRGINDKENEEVAGNGFISTKKNQRRPNNENYLHKAKNILKRCSRNGETTSTSCRNEDIERRVLSERTNMEQSDAIGVTGTWKCPQNSKPKVGPPMKQLRLERWINRL